MSLAYTILPDGTIFRLKSPADYVCAAEIIKEEIGDMFQNDITSNAGPSFVSMSSSNDCVSGLRPTTH